MLLLRSAMVMMVIMVVMISLVILKDDHHPHDQECIADGLGDVLHAANGEETTAVANPPVTNVPWSNFDGQSSSLIS